MLSTLVRAGAKLAPRVAAKQTHARALTQLASSTRSHAAAARQQSGASTPLLPLLSSRAAAAARRLLSSAAAAASDSSSVKHAGSSSAAPVEPADEQRLTEAMQALTQEGRFDEAERVVEAELAAVAKGTNEHIAALRRMSKIYLMQSKFPEAQKVLQDALMVQQAIFEKDVSPATFLSSIYLLSHLVTCMRLGGINPADQSNLDALFDDIYVKGIKNKLLAKDPSFAGALETPPVYTFICYVVGSYLDGEAFPKAKQILSEHLLHDLESSAPSSVEGSYDLKDLRLASGLNFLGIALWSDHSACGGGGHAHHHHTHDHSAAEKAWLKGLEYTRPFTRLLAQGDASARGKLDDTDTLFLQATTIILDNLSQVKMANGDVDGAVEYSQEVVSNLSHAFPDLHHELIAAQAQLLKTLLEAQRMDDAEILCENMLKTFPHPSRTPDVAPDAQLLASLPSTVTLDTSRVLDELSNVMFQFGNADYAEKFLQLSLLVLQARLGGEPAAPGAVPVPVGDHPALARAFNGLGLLQIQMKDYESAERNLQVGLRMKLAIAAGKESQGDAQSQSAAAVVGDDGTAEFFHNLGLAQLGLQKHEEAEKNLLQAREAYHKRYTDDKGQINKVQANYAGLMSQLAQMYKMRGDETQALEFALESLDIKKQLFASHSPQLVSDLYLAAFLLSTSFGRHADAIPLYRQMVGIVERADGARPPNPQSLGVSLHWLAHALDKNGEPALAADSWRKALIQLEKCMSLREVVPVQRELLRVLQAIGMDDEAQRLEAKINANVETLEAAKAKAQDAAMAPAGAQSDAGAEFVASA